MDSVVAVDAHYRKWVGGGPKYVRLVQERWLLGLLKWPKGSSKIGLHIYATFGLHALVHGSPSRGLGHGFEILLPSTERLSSKWNNVAWMVTVCQRQVISLARSRCRYGMIP